MWPICCSCEEPSGAQELVAVKSTIPADVVSISAPLGENEEASYGLLKHLEGSWNRYEDSEFMATILGERVDWAKRWNTPTSYLRVFGINKISVTVDGTMLVAELHMLDSDRPMLFWDDSDVWVKQDAEMESTQSGTH
ncbi:unnamed protein product [Effrenium voratum]|uniref:Uncharacterized protein n=1 Tax=Effrenium voratum TaxID=2562239 RepID=A0AA36HXF7_9DINO|nr:unnamed protein product [Effrenium voratum]CAJ1422170.1 unnamed protein product [Effrenium voratum]